MSKNTCTPTSVYGPFEHTIFLGISVSSFSASVGWGEQASQLTVKLVEDTCVSTTGKVYWDSDLAKQTTYTIDDGFLGEDRWQKADGSRYSGPLDGADSLVSSAIELIGLPAYFRVGDFEMSGLIASWTRDSGSNENPAYTVVLTDPRQLLSGTRLITNEYAGSVGDTYNLFNAYGYMESFGVVSPQLYYNGVAYVAGDSGVDGAIFGSASGGFGGSNVNNNGMQFERIITAINLLCNTSPKISNQWSPYSRIIFKGVSGGGAGLMGWDLLSLSDGYLTEYLLDISELPTPPTYWRINSDDVSILEFISQLCEDMGHDYFIELLPIRGVPAALALSGIAKFIKVRTVARATQPSLGALNTFITNSAGTISKSTGKELRDETLNAFVIGGPKQVTYQAIQHYDPELDGTSTLSQLGTTIAIGDPEIDDLILPYMGQYENGDVIMPIRDANGRWLFELPTDGINAQLTILDLSNPNSTPVNRLTITEAEIRAAAVSYDSWMSTTSLVRNDLYDAVLANQPDLRLRGIRDVDGWFNFIRDGGNAHGRDLMINNADAFLGRQNKRAKLESDFQRIHKWLHVYATEFYGRKFQVRVPYTSVIQDSESQQYLTSEAPSEGGWTELPNVIGLANPGSFLDFFRLEDNRIGVFGRFPNASGTLGAGSTITSRDIGLDGTFVDVSEFDPLDYGLIGNKIYIKCEVEPDYVYFDQSSYASPRAVVEFAEPIMLNDNGGQNMAETNMLLQLKDLAARSASEKVVIKNGIENAWLKVASKLIDAPFLYPLQMPEAVTFGIKSNTLKYGPWKSGGKPGRVRTEVDEGLVPWEYGSIATMNLAGQSQADEGLTNMQIGEMGRITVPGYPTISLGAELNGTSSLLETRTLSNTIVNETVAGGAPFVGIFYYFGSSIAVGINGPSITDISVGVSEQGVQTTYAMATFTERFGRLTKNNSETLKNIGQFRLKQQKQARAVSYNRSKKFFNNKIKAQNRRLARFPGVGQVSHTPNEVLVGSLNSIMSSGTDEIKKLKRSVISLNPITELPNEASGYENKAYMSLDGLFRSISMDGDGGLPQYATPVNACQKTTSVGAHPPIFVPTGIFCITGVGSTGASDTGNIEFHVMLSATELYKNVINIDYLNPFSNPSGVGSRTGLMDRVGPLPISGVLSGSGYLGHDIDIIGRGTTVPDSGMVMPVAGFDGSGGADYAADYRALGMRGPIILQSWGYDLNGKPVPNAGDTEVNASGGIFANTGLHDRFMDSWLKKSHTWPVAPIDLRFDRARGTWVSPPSYRLVKVQLETDLLSYGQATGILFDSESLYGETGNLVDGNFSGVCTNISGISSTGNVSGLPRIILNDVIGSTIDAQSKVLAYYDPYACQYYPLGNVGTSGVAEMIKFRVSPELDAGDAMIGISAGTIEVLLPKHGTPPRDLTPNITGVKNTFSWDANNLAIAIAVRNFDVMISGAAGVPVGSGVPEEQAWEGLQVACP